MKFDNRGKYAESIEDLKEPQNAKQALECLNEMVTNAMEHVTDCLDYLLKLHQREIFKFCAIPQVFGGPPTGIHANSLFFFFF